ncbi:cyclophilin type peptidyl-prolyl cis-trans isomerase/CLD domain-containing protein [Ditylenchus destructor]|uniref:Peptidyl-prolyl cis-trans isomerase n=1 Tax=Ditylenchus destructor TaxID=166010 RepID=A0AAD4R393_9BILA|nr:cyclophilin type peptidyl-prolyl cis-trans isomerase/CLD domain-containing protein [Ditylenchus destructor]
MITIAFNTIFKPFMFQGGDFINGDGTCGEGIYGERFDKESFAAKHDSPGILSTVDNGSGVDGSQFRITLCAWPNVFDSVSVAFGKIVQGIDILNAIEKEGPETGYGAPKKNVVIIDCGQL